MQRETMPTTEATPSLQEEGVEKPAESTSTAPINRDAKTKEKRLGIFDVIPSTKTIRQLNKAARIPPNKKEKKKTKKKKILTSNPQKKM